MIEEDKTQLEKTPFKEGIKNAVQNTGDVFGVIVKTVSEGIVGAAKGGGTAGVAVLEAVGSIVRSVVKTSLGVGSNLALGTKAIVMGVIRGTGEKGEAALKSLAHTARIVIHQTVDMNGDVGAAASALVLAATASAKHMEVEPSKAAAAVREAVLAEAARIGSVTEEKVRAAVKGDVESTPAAAPEALKT